MRSPLPPPPRSGTTPRRKKAQRARAPRSGRLRGLRQTRGASGTGLPQPSRPTRPPPAGPRLDPHPCRAPAAAPWQSWASWTHSHSYSLHHHHLLPPRQTRPGQRQTPRPPRESVGHGFLASGDGTARRGAKRLAQTGSFVGVGRARRGRTTTSLWLAHTPVRRVWMSSVFPLGLSVMMVVL